MWLYVCLGEELAVRDIGSDMGTRMYFLVAADG
jgi:hypothetical protein